MPLLRSMIRLSCLALMSGVALSGWLPVAAQNVTPTPETGVTPSTLLLYRADLLSGKETAYEQTESEIVSAYADAKIPIYWSALQAVTGSPHVLYFDGFDNFADIEKSGADLAQGLDAHPEIGGLQQQRSEERRVGKECRSRWGPYGEEQKRESDIKYGEHAAAEATAGVGAR